MLCLSFAITKLVLIFACSTYYQMGKLFEIQLLDEAFSYLKSLEKKHSEKILYNIRKAQTSRDPELFKRLTDDIWEFRTIYQGNHYRLLAFWDKSGTKDTLVISTHGFVKKRSKVPNNEIQGAVQLRARYFEEKQKS